MSITNDSTNSDSKTPEQIRDEIEETRNNLGYDVDALADKVNPSSIAHRQTEKVKGKFTSAKESLMGSVQGAKDSGSSATDALSAVPGKAANAAKGNALAVGLVAFGVGLLVSALIPASEKEQELAETVKEKAAPAVDAVKSAAQDAAQNLKEPALDGFNAVKESAQDAAGTVKDEAQSATEDVKDSAKQAQESVQNS
jgi:hypothetical protein